MDDLHKIKLWSTCFIFSKTVNPVDVNPETDSKKELIKIAAASGMELVILRPPLVYGPGVKGNFARLYAAILKDKIFSCIKF